MITEPLGGRRKISVRFTKTAIDLAEAVKTLLDVDYPNAERVVLVWDNLNTHPTASLYKNFSTRGSVAFRGLEKSHAQYFSW